MDSLFLNGLHHVSSLSAHIGRTRDFYTRVLGLRPVITTVNQDEPTMYHLFFTDGKGSPGSDMTVFDMRFAAPEYRGNNSISLTSFRVAGAGAFAYWSRRLAELGVEHTGINERDGRLVLDFDDPVGTQLSLVDDADVGESFPWEDSGVPTQHQLRGLGHITITVPTLAPTERFLVDALGLRAERRYPVADSPRFSTHVYAMGPGGPHAEVHVVVRDDLPRAKYGSGGVHHVALRVTDEQPMASWVDRLDSFGHRNSGVVDRHYFTSIYVREPNHVLFEFATEGPGFEVDGPIDESRLSLPPFLEPRRAEIEAALPGLGDPERVS
jgi:glyoxalase family protein